MKNALDSISELYTEAGKAVQHDESADPEKRCVNCRFVAETLMDDPCATCIMSDDKPEFKKRIL